ncbi:MAG: glutamate--tRNA ligase [bacterium]
MDNYKIRVRFAPSPTGSLHIGNARTALFNWLFAKSHDGTFILRIEDTDRERSTRESEDTIKTDLKWLGLNWDEGVDVGGEHGPYRQTERIDYYKTKALELVERHLAFYCFCSREELEEKKKIDLAFKRPPRYSGRCRNIAPDEAGRRIKRGETPAIRFNAEIPGKIVFKDLIKGKKECKDISDFVIIRSTGIASYSFAVVLDDAHMKISHVIRGEDHVSNTFRQVMLYQAFGLKQPRFAHLPLLAGEDKAPLSKRHRVGSVAGLRERGYLPEAVVNYLALLGWSSEQETDFITIEEIIREFSLKRVSTSPASFDFGKLDWLNGQYLKNCSPQQLINSNRDALRDEGYLKDKRLLRMVESIKANMTSVTDLPKWLKIYFSYNISDDSREFLASASFSPLIRLFEEKLEDCGLLDQETFSAIIATLKKDSGYKGKNLFMPVRIALSGKMAGPRLAEMASILGREECLKRIRLFNRSAYES